MSPKFRTLLQVDPRRRHIAANHPRLPDYDLLFSEEIALDLSFNADNLSVDIRFNKSILGNGDLAFLISTLPSTRPWITTSSSPESSPLMLTEGPMNVRSR